MSRGTDRTPSAATASGLRGWRLRRAERRLRDEMWRVEQWGFEGVYPSEIDKSRERFYRLIRLVDRLGGDPTKDQRYTSTDRHIRRALGHVSD